MESRTTIINQRAFTLVEVLIALMVFTIGILAVTTMELTATQTNSGAVAVTEATSLGRAAMEDLLNQDFDSAQLTDIDHDGEAGLEDTVPTAADYYQTSGRYNLLWNVAENRPVNNAKTIHVVVAWQTRGQNKTLSFASIKAR
jgi:prepilin-type N-terminal cleavage/methylation domain-containing protein